MVWGGGMQSGMRAGMEEEVRNTRGFFIDLRNYETPVLQLLGMHADAHEHSIT